MHRLLVHASIRVVTFKPFDLKTLVVGISTSVAGFPVALGGVNGINSLCKGLGDGGCILLESQTSEQKDLFELASASDPSDIFKGGAMLLSFLGVEDA